MTEEEARKMGEETIKSLKKEVFLMKLRNAPPSKIQSIENVIRIGEQALKASSKEESERLYKELQKTIKEDVGEPLCNSFIGELKEEDDKRNLDKKKLEERLQDKARFGLQFRPRGKNVKRR